MIFKLQTSSTAVCWTHTLAMSSKDTAVSLRMTCATFGEN